MGGRLFTKQVRVGIAVLGTSATLIWGGSIARSALTPEAKTISQQDDSKLTSDQRSQLHKANSDGFDKKYAAWLQSPVARSVNLRQLQRNPLMAEYSPGEATLAAAVAKAKVIVKGRATAIEFKNAGTQVTFTVDGVLKGAAGSQVVLREAGGLRPTQDFNGATLAEANSAPLLLPGDHATLFLDPADLPAGEFYIQSFSGFYRSDGGHVQALRGNSFASNVNGLSESTFAGQVNALVAAPPAN